MATEVNCGGWNIEVPPKWDKKTDSGKKIVQHKTINGQGIVRRAVEKQSGGRRGHRQG